MKPVNMDQLACRIDGGHVRRNLADLVAGADGGEIRSPLTAMASAHGVAGSPVHTRALTMTRVFCSSCGREADRTTKNRRTP